MNENNEEKQAEQTQSAKKKKTFGKLTSSKFLEIFIIVVVCVVALLIFANQFDFLGNEAKGTAQQQTVDFDTYVFNLENKLAQTISDIEGVGKATVAITFVDSGKKVYAYENVIETSGGLLEQELVLYKGEPIVLKEEMPEILGVVVVAKGATNAAVRLNIVRTVQVLLGVTYDKIEVFAYKS